ncbi:MAG: helix-turn-helix transcriptional regulator [Sphingomonadaceae bacterium]|nr:helix-turn-helix transcriptional regulator [Sphingomonadaceae bacterium]
MAVTLLEAGDLVAMLHRGTLGSGLWGDFLDALCRRTGADHAAILLRAGRDLPRLTLLERSAQPLAITAETPHPSPVLRSGRVYSGSELEGPDNPLALPPFPDLLTHHTPDHLRIMRVEEPSGGALWIMIQRNGRDFSASDATLLSNLSDHLEIALRTWGALERERLRAGISGEAIRRLNFGWAMLDPAGRIIDLSDEAEALLQDGKALQRSPAGKLLPSLREAQGGLRRFLESVLKGEEGSRAIHLCDEPWLDMLLTTARGAMRERAGGPVIVAYVHGEQPDSSERASQLSDLFGLTEREAQLALMISRGVKIAEAAPQLRITVETARLYSKRIYAKTGTRGQADLVRLILASIVALG